MLYQKRSKFVWFNFAGNLKHKNLGTKAINFKCLNWYLVRCNSVKFLFFLDGVNCKSRLQQSPCVLVLEKNPFYMKQVFERETHNHFSQSSDFFVSVKIWCKEILMHRIGEKRLFRFESFMNSFCLYPNKNKLSSIYMD